MRDDYDCDYELVLTVDDVGMVRMEFIGLVLHVEPFLDNILWPRILWKIIR